jgi:2-polyprenyl-6-methoxyphenol hydroxylase-like FAD-dependent oxidoreductase
VVKRYGAPCFYIHRGDLHAALADIVPQEIVHREHKLHEVTSDDDGVTSHFEHGGSARADIVIGADGIHSVVGNNFSAPAHQCSPIGPSLPLNG